eukprot:CAMPEP_0184744362 /NCGR_PEP_ID=MMETSP0315-20130426/7156_1 /TAXON_ID=101924 /ORGANISM="Rhodosorus marinus, Strain UTEX LB 2760" /LENGTH=209 /DNA_ID=CAMNT_0027216059 /DNA_START=97 /DNA_END=726 /DNA_ORIENTATION=+
MSESCGGHGHSCEGHNHNTAGDGDGKWDLYKDVDTTRCSVLNAADEDALEGVLRPWEKRLEREPMLQSDADEQLMIYLPFTTAVRIQALSLIGSGGRANPKTLKVFLNVEHMDFDSAESTAPTQEWELVPEDREGNVEYTTKYTKYQNVRSMWLFISENFGGDNTSIQYIGLKGTSTKYRREAVKTSYELRPQVADHKTENESFSRSIL